MDKLEHYLDQVCRSIGGPRSLRQHVRQELREHLLDAAAEHQGGRACRRRRRWPARWRISAGRSRCGRNWRRRTGTGCYGGGDRQGHAVEGDDDESEMAVDDVGVSDHGGRGGVGTVVLMVCRDV